MKEKKTGRVPFGKKPMTGVEKNRRMLMRRKLLNEVAEAHGYKRFTVFLNNKQVDAIEETVNGWGDELGHRELNSALFRELKYSLEHSAHDLSTVKDDEWPKYCAIDAIYADAQLAFMRWEEQQNEGNNE
jgi:hypothetical protein